MANTSSKALLPPAVTPILVTDAGFRAPWFRAVAKLGWHSVGRFRHRTLIKVDGGDWFDNRRLLPQFSRRRSDDIIYAFGNCRKPASNHHGVAIGSTYIGLTFH